MPNPSCVICGCLLQEPFGVRWFTKFRALTHREPGGPVYLTGIGINDNVRGDLGLAPWDVDASNENLAPFEYLDLKTSPTQARLVYLRDVFFHQSCWMVLQRYFPDIDQAFLERLHDTCASIPYEIQWASHSPHGQKRLSWGHDYYNGRAFNHVPYRSFSWESPFYGNKNTVPRLHGFHDIDSRADPFDPAQAYALLARPPEHPPEPTVVVRAVAEGDIFSRLPLEIRSEITALLSLPDFMDARLASVAFYHDFHHQKWWAKATSLKWIEQPTAAITNPAAEAPDGTVPDTTPFTCLATGLLDEVVDGGILSSEKACRTFHRRRVSVPCLLKNVSVYLVELADAEYVCGLRFDGKDDSEPVQVGFSSDFELDVAFDGPLEGLIIGMGARGVQAIKFVGSADSTVPPRWLGDLGNSSRTERLLIPGNRITTIEAAFDGCKLVSLAIEDQREASEPRNLRTSAFWYPKIPGPSLTLSKHTFPDREYATSYAPLLWTNLGGERGGMLWNMKSITCLFGYRCIEAIEFDMNTRDLALLGRPKGGTSEQNFDTFEINGSDGERIDMVDIYYQIAPNSRPRTVAEILNEARDRPLDSSKFRALGIFTNHGRRHLFRPHEFNHIESTMFPMYRVKPARDTIITGFFGEWKEDCLSALGVVTEKDYHVGASLF